MREIEAFGPLMITFDDRVLRPRSWTLAQSGWGAEVARQAPDGPILELCAGVGQIGLAAARFCVDAGRPREVVLVDVDPHASEFARTNAERAGLPLPVQVRTRDLRRAVGPDEVFPVILADPPWVPSDDTHAFPEDPLSAIDGGAGGLDLAVECLTVIGAHLHPAGFAVLQLGSALQVEVLERHLREHPGLGLRPSGTRRVSGANGILLRLDRGRLRG